MSHFVLQQVFQSPTLLSPYLIQNGHAIPIMWRANDVTVKNPAKMLCFTTIIMNAHAYGGVLPNDNTKCIAMKENAVIILIAGNYN